MSRFDAARWDRIVIWSAAALAWGTAVIATSLQAPEAETAPPPATVGENSELAPGAMPRPTSQGLVILRFTPDGGNQSSTAAASSSTPSAPSAQAGPEPASSGS